MTYDLDSNAILYVWLSTGGQFNPMLGSLGRLRDQALALPKDGVYAIEIECDGARLDYATIKGTHPLLRSIKRRRKLPEVKAA